MLITRIPIDLYYEAKTRLFEEENPEEPGHLHRIYADTKEFVITLLFMILMTGKTIAFDLSISSYV